MTKPQLTSFAPQFLVDDLARSMAYYQRLGFAFGEPWDGFYAIGRLDGLELHLKEAPKHEAEPDLEPERNTISCYWRVADADLLYREFAALGLPSTDLPRLTLPQDESWGMREFTLKDPAGNLVRVGHELADA